VVIPPIVVSAPPDCWFFSSGEDALATGIPTGAKVFDGTGQRLRTAGGELSVAPDGRDGDDELAVILTDWLCHMDAVRWSLADWPLHLLLRCSVEHAGWSG
jgi:hypothetical protein